MIRNAASKVMWVGRATVFLVGLAVILAVSIGLASTALAHTEVDDRLFHLNHSNSATKPTSLVSTLVDATKSALIVNNRSGGPALELRVGNATTPANDVAPMKVNSNHVVTNLNADQLDGQEASAFLGASAQAADSDKLDDLDSTDFQRVNAAAGGDLSGTYPDPQIAPDSVGASEIRSTEVQRRVSGSCTAGSSIRSVTQDGTVVCESDSVIGHEIVTNSTALNDSSNKQISADCPSGKIAISGGAQYSISADTITIGNTADIALQRIRPFDINTWAATADYVGGGTTPEWRLIIHLVCINA